jgi:iron complex outermembrane recepter protein
MLGEPAPVPDSASCGDDADRAIPARVRHQVSTNVIELQRADVIAWTLELHARPLHGLDISSGVGYQHAVITKAGAGGAASPLQPGDRVYQMPDWTANTAVTYTTALSSRFNLINNLSYSYVGNSKSANNDPFVPRTRAHYALLDARFALAFARYEVALVGKNLTNEDANLADNRSIAVELPGRPRIVTNQPITFGIEFRSTFK